ncbi:hypothetical protein LOAG_00480 [Loa loa]|uniref:Uncharacterized protein n=1 Tax=Loa loa TaxID=7209 RepID=A0A1S0UBR0_LOALO|nr:hypothetical protein LOAG_00480 [Loa loa]EFO28004.1 hypothetical protein LOAG_00480 [Loa loa]
MTTTFDTLQIEVTELLENISIALHYLQKLDLFSATNCELRIFQKDITALTGAVTNLKYKIQKTFKDITFQEDIQCLTSSKESICGLSSKEMADKTWRNIQEPKELDETQSESVVFHHRFAAGSSIIASEGHLRQEEVRLKGKKKKPGKTDPSVFEEIIQDSGYNNLESKQLANPSSYDFSNNTEAPTFLLSSREENVKKWREMKNIKPKEIRYSKNMKEIVEPMTFFKPADKFQFQSKQNKQIMSDKRKIFQVKERINIRQD